MEIITWEEERAMLRARLTPEFLETLALICESAYDLSIDDVELCSTYRELCLLAEVEPRELNPRYPEEHS